MAALVDTSIPEITRQISREAELPEPDVVVKSKPRPVDLMQQNGVEEDGGEEEIEPDVVVKSKPRPVLPQDQNRSIGQGSHMEPSDSHVRIHQQQPQTLSPTSSIAVSQVSSEVRQKRANGDIGRGDKEKVAPSQVVAESIDQVTVKREEEFEDSTAMLLRRYTGSKSGRQGHIPITSTGEIGGIVSLKETFRVAGRSCTVQLEEDYISWVPNGKKDGEWISAKSIGVFVDHFMYMYV